MIAIEAGSVLTPFDEISPGRILIENGQIAAVGGISEIDIPSEIETMELRDKRVVPGFIDTHTHGRDGCYFGETAETNVKLCRNVVETGVTSLLPTLSSLLPVHYSLDMILDSIRSLQNVRSFEGGAEILGIHMEGPFLSGEEIARGSQLVINMRKPSVEELQEMVDASGRSIKKMTIAPEMEGSIEVIREMVRQGIVPCAGHSTATYEKALEAIEVGLRCATHSFNGMPPLHHRNPGLLGAVLTQDEINAELIADGEHVSAPAIDILLRCKGVERVHLVTDNTIWAGLPDGIYEDGDRHVVKEGQKAYVKGGTLVGSVVSMNRCVVNMIRLANCSLSEALQMASFNPAELIGCSDRKGSIAVGKDADLVVLDQEFEVHQTMVRGRIVYDREG